MKITFIHPELGCSEDITKKNAMVDDKNWTNDSWWTNHDEKESNQTPNVGDASSNLYRISSQTQNPVQ
jgi:hypothetical protein